MTETRKLAAILVADIVGYSRLAGADEDRILARLRTLRSDLIDPTISVHHGRVVKRTGDGSIIEFRSVVDAVRCAIEMQNGVVERNAGLPPERRIEFRVGIHLGDVVEESDGDLMGDGVNIAARLEGIAESGGICLSDDAYRQVRDRIKEQFTDLGDKNLKNIARPVRVYACRIGANDMPASLHSAVPEKSGPPRLSIVVLPFVNLGGDPEQEHFVDGVTESLTTDLSRLSGLSVIGRSTAFTYKGRAVDLKQVGRELNVRYVLEGSVQRGSNRIRVNAQLIDAESGVHQWSERFDKPVADLFDMQDEMVARLARQLDTALVAAEARRAERSPHPDSMDLYFRGMVWFNKGLNPKDIDQARTYYLRALEIDPNNIDALVWMAFADANLAGGFSGKDNEARLAAAEAAAVRALSLAPDHAWGHVALGMVFGWTNRVERAIAECERALAIDRNLATAQAFIGLHKLEIGRGEETEVFVQEALRLSPRDTWAFTWMAMTGFAKNQTGRYEEAVAWLRRSIDANPNHRTSHFHLAAALAHLGRLEEARAATRLGLAIDPQFTIAAFRSLPRSDNPTSVAQREQIVEGMRKAGVPEV